VLLVEIEGVVPIRGRVEFVPVLAQHGREQEEVGFVVVDDQDAGHATRWFEAGLTIDMDTTASRTEQGRPRVPRRAPLLPMPGGRPHDRGRGRLRVIA